MYAGPSFNFSNLNADWLDEWNRQNQAREAKTANAYDRLWKGMDALGQAGQYARKVGLEDEELNLKREYMKKRQDLLTKGWEEYLKGRTNDDDETKKRYSLMVAGVNPSLYDLMKANGGW